MKTSKLTLTVAAALSLAAFTAVAQNDERPRRPGGGESDGPPPGERGPRPDGQRGPGGPGGPEGQRGPGGPDGQRGFGGPGGRPMMPVMQALDANGDGTIDEAEIDGAVIALKKLDKNGDRKLTGEELRPQGFGGPGGPGFGGPREGGMRPEGDRGFGGPRPEGGDRGPGGGNLLGRLMENDKNGDGKLQKDELPERMQQVMERADTNGDGALDKAELDEMAARMRDRGPGGPGGPGGQRGPRDGGAGDNDNRPKRPPVDQ
jgi:collagen type III alpha